MYGIYEDGKVIARFTVPMSVRSNVPVFATDVMSLKRDVSRRGAQRWEINTDLEPLSDESNDLFALTMEKGLTGTVEILFPQNTGVRSKRMWTGFAGRAYGVKNANTITVSGVGEVPRGTMVRFGNHSKIYMLTGSVLGSGSVGVFPRLRVDVPSDTLFYHGDDVVMPSKIDFGSNVGATYSDGLLMQLKNITFIEAL